MKKYFRLFIVVLLIGILYFGCITYPKLDLISGFSAKSMASGHFIANRSQNEIEQQDNDIEMINLAKNQINDSEKWATASVFGLKKRKAIYRPGLGAVLINDEYDSIQPYCIPRRSKIIHNLPFPYGNTDSKDTVFDKVNYNQLNKIVASAFDKKGEKNKRTRSLLVIYKDKIIAEKYTRGFDKDSKILGWSMTKSITGTLFGILQKQHKYNIYKPVPISEWQHDVRRNITTNDLLHMNSGLEWEEKYDKICDATKMLFQSENTALPQLIKPLQYKPNTHWNYSSGTTNLLSEVLRRQFPTYQEYLDFWYSALIDKIGMYSMIIETDMAGNFVGSSYGWATTRDWAKFGLLYLHKGNWNGAQIFDPSWVKYVTTPTNTSNGRYGAHFWLNASGHFPDAPRDLYYCKGFQGQIIAIIPSMELVIVRMGLTDESKFDFNGLLSGIVESLKKQ